jgi:hypothetical protein
MINLFNQCPSCGGPLIITECKCANCNLQMRGEFLPGKFSTLSGEQIAFIRVFFRARGNLTEVERVLGISYPTIRNKLDEINAVMDSPEEIPSPVKLPVSKPTAGPSDEESRKAILKKVADGQLSATEGLKKLQEL